MGAKMGLEEHDKKEESQYNKNKKQSIKKKKTIADEQEKSSAPSILKSHGNEVKDEFKEHVNDMFIEMPFTNQKKWDAIFKSLKFLSLKLKDTTSDFILIEEAIMNYNKNFKSIWNFRILKKYFNQLNSGESLVIRNTILKMIDLVFLTPGLMIKPLPYLKRGENKSIDLTQKQCAALLANAFFCTFSDRERKYVSSFNFNR